MKESPEELEKRPFEVTQKIEEMKKVRNEIRAALKGNQAKEEKRLEAVHKNSYKDAQKCVARSGAEPYSLKLKKTHSRGDFYGRFHPSKSSKGIKRSE